MEPRIIVPCHCQLGEGPQWNPFDNRIYWTDIDGGRLLRYEPGTESLEVFYEGGKVGGMTVQADGSLLLFMEHGAIRRWRDGAIDTIVEEIPEVRGSRFNDVIVDPQGCVFCGTIAAEGDTARLYRLALDGSVSCVLDGLGMANGMGFTPDNRGLYLTDTGAHRIELFDYDSDSGELSNRRLFVDLREEAGGPDGLTVDREGFVWSARWGGSMIVRYRPDGQEESRVSFPTENVTSLIFGGDDYRDLYVTTAGGGNTPNRREEDGALYYLRPAVGGTASFLSRVRLHEHGAG